MRIFPEAVLLMDALLGNENIKYKVEPGPISLYDHLKYVH